MPPGEQVVGVPLRLAMAEKYQLGHGFERIRLGWWSEEARGHSRVLGRRPGGGYHQGWTGKNYHMTGGHEAEAKAEQVAKGPGRLGLWVLRKLAYEGPEPKPAPRAPTTVLLPTPGRTRPSRAHEPGAWTFQIGGAGSDDIGLAPRAGSFVVPERPSATLDWEFAPGTPGSTTV